MLVICALVVGGCGDEARGGGALVDAGAKTPPVNALEPEPGGRSALLSTNRGLYRVDLRRGRATPVRSRVRRGHRTTPVGRFLNVASASATQLLGSGHPDRAGRFPPYLGLMESRDRGRTWSVLARYGLADLHVIRLAHGRIYAADAVLGGLLVGSRSGRRWVERSTPSETALDLAVDPRDPRRLVLSDGNGVHRSEDQGRSWRQIASGRSSRLAWPAGGPLYRADADGRVFASDDAGTSFELADLIDGEPVKLAPLGPRHLLMALSDATILESTDAGASWKQRFEP